LNDDGPKRAKHEKKAPQPSGCGASLTLAL
jgi:hypothetical protein